MIDNFLMLVNDDVVRIRFAWMIHLITFFFNVKISGGINPLDNQNLFSYPWIMVLIHNRSSMT
jgi:hypothetical protein